MLPNGTDGIRQRNTGTYGGLSGVIRTKGILGASRKNVFREDYRGRVGRHAPVAAWAEAYAADFGTVWQTGALELLVEETAEKYAFPLKDCVGVELSGESVYRQRVDTLGSETVAECVIQEEIVQVVRAYKVFGLQLYCAVGFGRN